MTNATTEFRRSQDAKQNNLKKITIPACTETIGDWMDFVDLEAYTFEVSEAFWEKTDFLGMIEKATRNQKQFDRSEMLFKILREDGTYYYSYLDYQDGYGEFVYYSQDLKGEYYHDDEIDEELLRKYDTQMNVSRKVIARLCRVATPYLLSDENKAKFVSYIKRYALVGVAEAARFDCPDLLKCLFAYNLIKDEQINEVKNILEEKKAEDCIACFESLRTTERISIKKSSKAPVRKSISKTAFSPLSDKDTNGFPGVMVTRDSKPNAIDVRLSTGKKYTYLTRYRTSNDDKVIIGTGHISSANIKAEKSKNSGIAGTVENNNSASSVKRQYAVEIAFSFSDQAESIGLYECIKYLDAPGDLKSLNTTTVPDRIYPITFLVRKMLAALTVLQFSKFAGGYDSLAREYLNATHILPQEMMDLFEPCGGYISISDMTSAYLTEYSESFATTRRDAANGYILHKAGTKGKISKRDELDAFINHYVLIATAEVLMRCHLPHMMKVYLENCAALKPYTEILAAMAKELGAEDCIWVLETTEASPILTEQSINPQASDQILVTKKEENKGFKSNVILPSRDTRSRGYDVEKINATEYKVTSKDKKHKVLERDGFFWCDCGDFKDEPKNCKHIVAVKRFMNDPFVLSKAPNFRIEAIPASGISKDDRYNKFIEQLKAAYKGVKTYTLQLLKDEQPNVPFDGLNKWVKEKYGMSVTEYLKSIGVLLPETYFEVVEDKINIDSLRGKKCCVLLEPFGIKNFKQVLTQMGAEIVSEDSVDIDYVFASIGYKIAKDPPSDYGGPFVELLRKRDDGKIQFGIISRSFMQKNEELIRQMDEEITDANRIVFSVENHIKESDIPKYNSDKLYWSLWYFKDWFGASGGKIRGELADFTIESELDDRKLIEQIFVLFEELYKNIHSESVKKYISRVANDEEWNKNKDYVIAPLAYIDNFSKYTAIVGRITDDNVITVSVKKLTLTKKYEHDDYILSDIPREVIPKKLVEAVMENDGNNILYQGAAKQDCEENDKGQKTESQSCEKVNTSEKKLAECKKVHDELRKKIVSAFNGNDYLYPQSSDFRIEGVFIEDPDIDVFKDLCEYAASDGESRYDGEWSALELYSFLHEKTIKHTMGSRYTFYLDFGGLPPVLVVLSYLSVYSEIRCLKVTFTRDKWEVRGDYSSKTRVGIKYLYGKFVVDNFSDTDKEYDCERWDYIPGNYTVTDIPGSSRKSLVEYEPRSQQADVLVLPEAIMELQRNVFKGCEFKHVFFVVHRYYIEAGAFSECKRLECIVWPNTLYICENMFKNCINLTTVTIPEGVFGIEKGAFAGCKNLMKINIPSTIAFIEEGAFDGCDALSSNNPEVWNQICSTNKSKAKFLDDIESYKQYIVNNGYATFEAIYYGFQYIIDTMNACKLWHKLYDSYIGNLDKLNVGNYKYVLYATKNQLARIETNYNTKIAELGWKKTRDVSDTTDYLIVDTEDIPRFTTFMAKQDSIAKGERDQRFCAETPVEKAIELIDAGRSIKIITLKNFCELLNMGAVSNEVFISRSDSLNSSDVKITKEGKEVPKSVKQESKSNIEDSVPVSEDFVVFRGILKQYNGKESEVVVPETVTTIGERAFKDNKKLKAVILHNGIVRIDGGAFGGCTSLQSIVIPDGVSKIDWGTFNECSALKEVTLGTGVTNIGERAFRNCRALKNLFVSDTVTYFGVSAFDGCGSLTITGYADSKAEKYALANGIEFKRVVAEDKPAPQAEVTVSNAEINREEELCRIREDNERRVREDQERQARIEAEERKEREEAERKAREEAERKAHEEAERKAREEAERKAREEAEHKAHEEAERKAREEAERKAREEAERKAREEAERKAREEAERKAREEAERKAEEERRKREERKKREERRRLEEEARRAEEARIAEERRIQHEKRARTIKKVSIISAIIVAFAVAFAIVLATVIIPSNTYKKAEKLFAEGQYDQAEQLYAELGNYGNSENKLYVISAISKIEDGKYEDAIKILLKKGIKVSVMYDVNADAVLLSNKAMLVASNNTEANSFTYDSADSFDGLKTPKRSGYRFVKWSLVGYNYLEDGSFALSLVSDWKVENYKIELDLQGGSAANRETYTVEDKTFTLAIPEKAGYTFVGWSSGDGTELLPTVEIKQGSCSDISYTAHWKANEYTIHLEANGGSLLSDSLSIAYDEEYSLPTPMRKGYTFMGWFDGETKVENGTYRSEKDIFLMALWQVNDYKITYEDVFEQRIHVNVYFDSNNGEVQQVTLYSGDELLFDDLWKPYKDNYIFTGWYSDRNCTQRYRFDSAITHDLTLYAGWEANANIHEGSFMMDRHQGYNTCDPAKYDSEDKSISFNAYFPGYLGGDYNTYYLYLVANESGEHKIYYKETKKQTRTVFYNITQDESLITDSVNSYGYSCVTFVCNEGDLIGISFRDKNYSSAKVSFYFEGFTTLSGKTSQVNIPTGNEIVYGVDQTNEITVTYGDLLAHTVPRRDGYLFDGWYYGDEKVEDGAWTFDEDVTLTARWSPIS